MSRGQFMSNNKEDEVFNFKTNSSGFINPGMTISGLKRVHWDWGDGSSYLAANFGSHTYSSGGTKNCRFIGDNFSVISSLFFNSDSIIDDVLIDSRFTNLNNINFSQNIGLTGITVGYIPTPLTIDVRFCNIIGDLDLTNVTLTGLNNRFNNNSNLTSITHTASTENIGLYEANNCDLTGNHDMSMLPGLGGSFRIHLNSALTGITHTTSTEVFSNYLVYSCDITGNHDMSMFPNLGGTFQMYNNSSLTGITHTASTETFSSYRVDSCDLTGNHDMSMLPGLGGTVFTFSNPNLTSITHTASTESFVDYWVPDCNLTGNHDMSMFPNFSGKLLIYNNPLLTGITHTTSTGVINSYRSSDCNITGNHDVSMFPNLGGGFLMDGNSNLTGVTHTASTETFISYDIFSCDLTGNHDVSMLTGLGGRFRGYNNSNLIGITLPNTIETFKNISTSPDGGAFSMYNCDLGYVNFNPLSSSTMDSQSINGVSIYLDDNNMTAGEVNHILSDFSGITSNNISTWSGVTLDISGNNTAPDSSSGGYNGIDSITYLTGATPSWTIITS